MRSVAAKAGVSPSLVVHHHRTKAQLREAVDDAVVAALDARGHLVPGLDPTWRSYTAVYVILGPALLHRQLSARLGIDAFAPDVVRARSACTMAILHHGLFRS